MIIFETINLNIEYEWGMNADVNAFSRGTEMSAQGMFVAAALIAAFPSSGAFASSGALTDSQYLAVARCSGLAAAKSLGVSDGPAFEALMKAQEAGRIAAVVDRADETRSDAMRQAGRAGPTMKLGLMAEHDGACQAWLAKGVSPSAAGGSAGRSASPR